MDDPSMVFQRRKAHHHPDAHVCIDSARGTYHRSRTGSVFELTSKVLWHEGEYLLPQPAHCRPVSGLRNRELPTEPSHPNRDTIPVGTGDISESESESESVSRIGVANASARSHTAKAVSLVARIPLAGGRKARGDSETGSAV